MMGSEWCGVWVVEEWFLGGGLDKGIGWALGGGQLGGLGVCPHRLESSSSSVVDSIYSTICSSPSSPTPQFMGNSIGNSIGNSKGNTIHHGPSMGQGTHGPGPSPSPTPDDPALQARAKRVETKLGPAWPQ